MSSGLKKRDAVDDSTTGESTGRSLSDSKFLLKAIEQTDVLVIMYQFDGKILRINKACERISEYAADKLKQNLFWEIFCSSAEIDLIKKGHEALKSGMPIFIHESFCIAKGGASRLIRWSEMLQAGSLNGEECIIAIGVDISERRSTEEALIKARDEAEEASKFKSQFLANMSHEIRTPMNGIIGMSSLLRESCTTQEQLEYVDIITSSADALMKIINDILDFSKIEAGMMDLECTEMNLYDAVSSVVKLLAPRTAEKGVELLYYFDPRIPVNLLGDSGRIRQVLFNLAGNGIKFTEKGEVFISLHLKEETATHVTVRFNITDTGVGIPTNYLNRLFKSFSQVDASTTRKFGGTGLGLAISERFVEMMGGKINVISKEGIGSAFWFIITFKKSGKTSEHLNVIQSGLYNKKILVVDDNAINRKIISTYLESWNSKVEMVSDSMSALQVLKSAKKEDVPFDLALIDYLMPDMDGEMLGMQIKNDPLIKDTILILLTNSYNNREKAERIQSMGFAAFMAKPITYTELFKCIMSVFSEKQQKEPVDLNQDLRQRLATGRENVRVLVIDNSMLIRKLLGSMLKNLGYQEHSVGSGNEAIDAVQNGEYDILFFCCDAGNRDWTLFVSKIREMMLKADRQNVPIILCTNTEGIPDLPTLNSKGITAIVHKPIRPENIDKLIREHVSESNREKKQL